jgi:hypothetical protein
MKGRDDDGRRSRLRFSSTFIYSVAVLESGMDVDTATAPAAVETAPPVAVDGGETAAPASTAGMDVDGEAKPADGEKEEEPQGPKPTETSEFSVVLSPLFLLDVFAKTAAQSTSTISTRRSRSRVRLLPLPLSL